MKKGERVDFSTEIEVTFVRGDDLPFTLFPWAYFQIVNVIAWILPRQRTFHNKKNHSIETDDWDNFEVSTVWKVMKIIHS